MSRSRFSVASAIVHAGFPRRIEICSKRRADRFVFFSCLLAHPSAGLGGSVVSGDCRRRWNRPVGGGCAPRGTIVQAQPSFARTCGVAADRDGTESFAREFTGAFEGREIGGRGRALGPGSFCATTRAGTTGVSRSTADSCG